VPGVTNIVLDHARAATLAMEHLTKLGHTHIAFIKGQEFSSDTAVRWEAVRNSANELGISINNKLVGQLEGEFFFTRTRLSSRAPIACFRGKLHRALCVQ